MKWRIPNPFARLRPRTRKILASIAITFGLCMLYKIYWPPPQGPQGEVPDPNEAAYGAQIGSHGITISAGIRAKAGNGSWGRDAHNKPHGCAAANFTVKSSFDPAMRVGLFGEPKSYKAWVRFSSGNQGQLSDWLPDARGMAIKIMGVPGKKLLEGEQDETTQDFLGINDPVFFIPNVKEYVTYTGYQALGNQTAYFLHPAWNPFAWKLYLFRIALGAAKWPPRELLGTQFYSMTAFRMGAANNIKYSMKPVACEGSTHVPSDSIAAFGGNALRSGIARYLKDRPACFDFMVQLQVPGKNMPVEDPSVTWSEKASPFIPLARIEIPKQPMDTPIQGEFCDNLSFSAWHSLPEHEPIGGMNRIRKVAYQSMARFRRCMNGKMFGEPKDDGTPEFNAKGCDPHLAVPTIGGPPST